MSVNDGLEASMDSNLWAVDDGSDIVVKLDFNGTDWQGPLLLFARQEPFGDDRTVISRAASIVLLADDWKRSAVSGFFGVSE